MEAWMNRFDFFKALPLLAVAPLGAKEEKPVDTLRDRTINGNLIFISEGKPISISNCTINAKDDGPAITFK